MMRTFHARSDGTYGAPRLQRDLRDAGESVGQKRVARLMQREGLVGVSRRRAPPRPRRTVPAAPPAPDLVRRQFAATAPNQLWVADITYVPTQAGFLYLAVVLDVFSRRVIGWAMRGTLHTSVVLKALEMATTQRRPTNVIHHSDQGSTRPSPSANAATSSACAPRWALGGMPTTTRWPKASSPHSSASSSLGIALPRTSGHGSRSFDRAVAVPPRVARAIQQSGSPLAPSSGLRLNHVPSANC